MRPRAAAPTLRRKATPAPTGPTEAQRLALDSLMRTAQREGDLWKYSMSAATVVCSLWRGATLKARAVYDVAEVARLGDAWPADVMTRLADPWSETFARGIA